MSGISFGKGSSVPTGANQPYTLFQTGTSFVYPSSGSIANNGALTLTTALGRTISGGCFMYFPANAIVAGSGAGWYWTVMSSTTVGTIYNNTYTSGAPKAAIPSAPTAFVTTGPGAYTQTTGSTIYGLSYTIPGGSFGTNGSIDIDAAFNCPSNANVKTVTTSYAALAAVSSFASTTGRRLAVSIVTENSLSAIKMLNGWQPAVDGTVTVGTDNTAVDQTLKWGFNIATATDYIVQEYAGIEISYGV